MLAGTGPGTKGGLLEDDLVMSGCELHEALLSASSHPALQPSSKKNPMKSFSLPLFCFPAVVWLRPFLAPAFVAFANMLVLRGHRAK